MGDKDTIYRQAAIDAAIKADMENNNGILSEKRARVFAEYISSLLSAQPEQCSDCIAKGGDWECDHIHCRKGRLPSAQQEPRWIPFKTRPMDEEERKEWSEKVGYELEGDDAVIYTSQLPDDGQECIVCTKWGNVFIDTFQNDPDYGCAFEDHGDMDGITAWMPLPKPWKGEKDG